MRKRLRLLGFLGLLLLVPALVMGLTSPAMAQPSSPTIDEIGSRVVCMCGCGSILNNCVHQECMERDEMRTAIGVGLRQGKSPDEIVSAFVTKYGEQVLAAPTKKGFNLTAWITPFLAILVGGIAIFFILKAWVLKGAAPISVPSPQQVTPPDKDADAEYRKRVEAELKQYGDGL